MNKFFLLLLLTPILLVWGEGANNLSLPPQSAHSPNPGKRYGHTLTYHEGRESLFLFGGFREDGTPLNDLWEWDGRRWDLVSNSGPVPRRWSGMVYDRAGGRLILFGGREGIGRNGKSLGDTWIWKEGWSLAASAGPPGRDHHGMAYDAVRQRVVVFGGWDGETNRNDTWEWDGDRWLRVSESGPTPRAAVGMTYDESDKMTLLFGGKDLKNTFGDLWAWDGKQWKLIEVPGPAPRSFHALAYHTTARKSILFGGRHDTVLLGDTWEWGNGKWSESLIPGPPRGGAYSMGSLRKAKTLVLYGGGFMQSGAWVLHSQLWLYREGQWKLSE